MSSKPRPSREELRALHRRYKETTDPAERDHARVVLAGVGCGDPEPGERPDRLTLPAPRDGLELIEDAAAALRSAGIDVSDLGLRRPTLDDVFLQLTGAPPSENGAASQPAAGARPVQPAPQTKFGGRATWIPRLRVPSPGELRGAIGGR